MYSYWHWLCLAGKNPLGYTISMENPESPPVPAQANAALYALFERLKLALDDKVADPAYVQRLAEWVYSSRGTRADNTLKALVSDIGQIAPVFKQIARPVLPMSPKVLAAYIDKLAQAYRASTVKRRVASIATLHQAVGLPSPAQAPIVKDALKRMRREKGTRTRQAKPLNTQHIQAILGLMTRSLTDLRDRCLFLLAHDTGLRSGELRRLRFEQVAIGPTGGADVYLEKSKTDQEGQGVYIAISEMTYDAIQDWSARVSRTEGPILLSFDIKGVLRDEAMTAKTISLIVQKWAAQIGLGEGISAHSIRVGFAQDLLIDGASDLAVRHAGRWSSSQQVMHYAERIMASKSAATRRFFRKSV